MSPDTEPSALPARERILRTAISLIAQHGAERVTHRMVAEAAEMSPGTLTYHFADRDGMIREAFKLYIDDYINGLDHALEARPLKSIDDVVSFLTVMTTLDPEDTELAAVEYELVSKANRDPGLREPVATWAASLCNAISAALDAGGHDSPVETANLLVGLTRGTEADVLTRRVRIEDEIFQERVKAVVKARI